jgi:DNA-binding beta-propeller fold protein YncE
MRARRWPTILLALGAAAPAAAQAPAGAGYHVTKTIEIGGEGGWDYLAYEPSRRHLFVSHSTEVDVVDPDAGAVVGKIPDTPGVHGIAIADDIGRGFVSDGRDSSVTIFDLATLRTLAKVHVPGRNPDAIMYDSVTGRVFTFNGGSGTATALDARKGTVIGSVALGGKPEFAVADGHGGIFVNIEDRSELVAIDARSLTVKSRWPLAGCEDPSALAIDRRHGRLFSGCGNEKLMITDAKDGHVVATPAIGGGVDAGAFDPGAGLAFSSTGDGNLSVIREVSPDSFVVAAQVPTRRGARTMALDPVTHRVFVSTASFGPAPAPTEAQPRPRPAIVPGSFVVLVLEP